MLKNQSHISNFQTLNCNVNWTFPVSFSRKKKNKMKHLNLSHPIANIFVLRCVSIGTHIERCVQRVHEIVRTQAYTYKCFREIGTGFSVIESVERVLCRISKMFYAVVYIGTASSSSLATFLLPSFAQSHIQFWLSI